MMEEMAIVTIKEATIKEAAYGKLLARTLPKVIRTVAENGGCQPNWKSSTRWNARRPRKSRNWRN